MLNQHPDRVLINYPENPGWVWIVHKDVLDFLRCLHVQLEVVNKTGKQRLSDCKIGAF